jgi:hypothetical protein
MTKKQQQIQRAVLWYQDKEVKVWFTMQEDRDTGVYPKEPYLQGTVDRSTGTYLILRNVILWNGTFFTEYDMSIGSIGRIIQKN